MNATLNGVCASLLVTGYVQVRRGRKEAHKKLMIAAVCVATLFLISYVTYHALSEVLTKFPKERYPGAAPVYYVILISHTLLAAATLPMVLITLWRALKQDWERHRRLARWTLPIWLYVSVTGVLIYLMLYHWFR